MTRPRVLTHPPVLAPDGTAHHVPAWRPPIAHVVGYLPAEHGPRYMSKLYRIDTTPLGQGKVEWSRWLCWREPDGEDRVRLGRLRWRRGRRM